MCDKNNKCEGYLVIKALEAGEATAAQQKLAAAGLAKAALCLAGVGHESYDKVANNANLAVMIEQLTGQQLLHGIKFSSLIPGTTDMEGAHGVGKVPTKVALDDREPAKVIGFMAKGKETVH